MSRMFEQVKREQLNQASRKVQTSKFELSRLKNKREENALMQSRLREESAEIEKHIKTVVIKHTKCQNNDKSKRVAVYGGTFIDEGKKDVDEQRCSHIKLKFNYCIQTI